MYAYITGRVAAIRESGIVLENNGIGYLIETPANVAARVSVGEERKLFTHFAVREDAMQLFGFLTEDDLGLFRMLLSVSGIGPKGALGVLSGLSADELRFAVLSGDAAALAKAPGIGKKTAQKIILELKDRLSLAEVVEQKLENAADTANPSVPKGSAQSEAVLALVALGYGNAEALKAVRKAAETADAEDVEALLKAALREL